jgi:hypothetical protein
MKMFGLTRVRASLGAAIVMAVATSIAVPGIAYGLPSTTPTTAHAAPHTPATPPTSTTVPTTSTTIGGPPIPSPSDPTTTTVPGPTTTTTIPPPPAAMPAFTLPTNSGLELLQTMQEAKVALKAAQGGIAAAQRQVAAAAKKDTAARKESTRLAGVAQKTRVQLDQTRTLLHQAAAEAYIHAGDAQLMTAIEGYLNTNSIVDAGSQLHVLGTFGTNTKNLLDQYLDLEQRVTNQVAQSRSVVAHAATTLRTAKTNLAKLRATIADSNTRIAVALAGIHDFQTAATSATSPILGPSLLTAKQMADYVVAQHYTPHITVPIGVLAQIYLDEGAATGVRGDVAFAQSILETGGFANPGSAATDNNFAGIGWCDSCAHGIDFPDAKTGVRAQLELLRIYVDPTFPDAKYTPKILLPGTLKLGFRGKVQTWWDLWGTWATGALYGQRVYDIYERMVLFAHTDPTVATPAVGKPAVASPADVKPITPVVAKKP